MRSVLIGFFVIISWTSSAFAQEIPQQIRTFAEQISESCVGAGGRFSNLQSAVRRVDLNGDGESDWGVDYRNASCAGAPNVYCSTAGCPLHILLAFGGTLVAVWEEDARSWRQVRIGNEPGIELGLHGSECNRPGNESCAKRFVFRGGKMVGVR